eukprot:jgi/Chlat1/5452/Chrsp36S05420
MLSGVVSVVGGVGGRSVSVAVAAVAVRRRCATWRRSGVVQLSSSSSACAWPGVVSASRSLACRAMSQAAQVGGMEAQPVASGDDNGGMGVSYLTAAAAAAIDERLMGSLGFSLDQLMELAGLSVASAVSEVYSSATHRSILIICGPGNNGGDGLVAARHLYHFGYTVEVCYPKRTDKPTYNGLVVQCESLGVPFISPDTLSNKLTEYDIVVDAIFGFSFSGTCSPRPPFDHILNLLKPSKGTKLPALVSVDIPSGWHVEEGDVDGMGLRPNMLVSLTAPKLCARKFTGELHYIGGRFVPPGIVREFDLRLPSYSGSSACVRVDAAVNGKDNAASDGVADLRRDYRSRQLLESDTTEDPYEQFQRWFGEAVGTSGVDEPNAMTLCTADGNGTPSARMVLLKGFDHRGFVWYTNYESRKSKDLQENPRAALVFWWSPLERQVRIEGDVERADDAESDEYYQSRPKSSRLSAWASAQSSVLPNREVLEQKAEELEAEYADMETVPRPSFWGGFRLRPRLFEFWQGRSSRLHDRIQYRLIDGEWVTERLSP